ncbi:hypothetical protein NF717_12370, partial [Lactococcus formosensis]
NKAQELSRLIGFSANWIKGPSKPMTLGFVTQTLALKDVCRELAREKQGRGVQKSENNEKISVEIF